MSEQTPITAEVCEVEGDPDLYGLVTITIADSHTHEIVLDFEQVRSLTQQLLGIQREIVWHRAQWMRTDDHGATHMARKGETKVLCGTPPPDYRNPRAWSFSPYFEHYSRHGFCKRCVAIYEKRIAEVKK